MVLTARYLGARESWIGLLISLTPYLVILQLFATNVAERWGYRRLMLAGWTARAFALLAILPLPLLVGRVSAGTLILVMFLAHFTFNLIRGFASGTWFPWLSQLIPEEKRGLYLGMDNTVTNLSALVALLASAFFLGAAPAGWRYSVLYAFAILAALASVLFLRLAPHRMPARSETRSSRSFGERARAARHVWSHPPFRRITRYVALYFFAQAAVPGFLVLYLRDQLEWKEGTILLLQGISTIGVFLTAAAWGWISDKAGSRPLMRLALWGNVVLLAFWTGTSLNWGTIHDWLMTRGASRLADHIPVTLHFAPGVLITVAVFLFMGLCGAAHGISHMRLILASCPEEEVTVGMSLFQVITSLAMGTSPLLWGFLLEKFQAFHAPELWGILTPFAVFFLCSFVLLLVAQLLLSRVPEPAALPTSGLVVQMVWRWPLRVLSGIVFEKRRSGDS